MHDLDREHGQQHAGVETRDPRVAPPGDAPREDIGEHGAIELQWRGDRGQVVGDGHAAHDERDLHDVVAGAISEGRRIERDIGCAEVHGRIIERLHAAARSNGLVVDADPLLGGEARDPLGVHGVGERRAGAGEIDEVVTGTGKWSVRAIRAGDRSD